MPHQARFLTIKVQSLEEAIENYVNASILKMSNSLQPAAPSGVSYNCANIMAVWVETQIRLTSESMCSWLFLYCSLKVQSLEEAIENYVNARILKTQVH